MSSDEDPHDSISVPAKKRRVQRACDACRKKRSDGLRMSAKKCTNCVENKIECTFAGALFANEIFCSYIDALEARLQLTPLNNEGESSFSAGWSNDSVILNHKSDAVPSRPPATAILLSSMIRAGYEQKDMPWVSHRMQFWNFDPAKNRVPHVGPFIFPEPDLFSALIDIYFARKNVYFPVLHRPTFERAITTILCAIVLLVCGIGARFSDDPRVLLPVFDQLPLVLGHLFERPTLYQLQFYCVARDIFLEFSAPSAGWTFIGLGLRLAQDVGAHREKHFGRRPTLRRIMEARFLDPRRPRRMVSNSLGRSCACIKGIRLAMPIDTSLELDSALNTGWDPNRRDEVFFDQSAYLHCAYYQVQMTIHRSFIPTLREPFPSLAICTNAARACSHVAEISLHRRQSMATPQLMNPVFTSGLILLLNVWSGKRTGLAPQMNSAIPEVHKCMAMMQVCEKRWQVAGLFWDILYNLATIGQFPLPRTVPPTTSASMNTQKRGAEDDPAPATHPAHQTNPLPTSSTDLGQLPVYHQQGDSANANANNWYSSSDLTTSGTDPLSITQLRWESQSVSNVGPTGEGMNDDVMAMWANAPSGFEFGDWGSYFNFMTALEGHDSA
ncbi:hypothetical protein B0H16DRAFT_1640447 [Mycena metata]|uniref:Zn(2)-C6 fungal-type domain-containing protein n=1 Tax=Mycena metata TaxID=1033252 RepID=A0AAD7DY95_9AGAR|nr:hypothetical protein B0H16DRAFT_1640447 [Mycena metata]